MLVSYLFVITAAKVSELQKKERAALLLFIGVKWGLFFIDCLFGRRAVFVDCLQVLFGVFVLSSLF